MTADRPRVACTCIYTWGADCRLQRQINGQPALHKLPLQIICHQSWRRQPSRPNWTWNEGMQLPDLQRNVSTRSPVQTLAVLSRLSLS